MTAPVLVLPFFLYSANQLIYADIHNLLPWIHYDYRGNVYDEVNHEKDSLHNFTMLGGGYLGADFIDNGMAYPGDPVLDPRKMYEHTFPVEGLGIWSQYFLPVSDFTFNDPSCINKPYLSFSDKRGDPDMRLIGGIHNHAPWAVRSWPYKDIAPSIAPKVGQSLTDWFGAQRVRASKYVKNFKLQPWLQDKVDKTNPRQPGDPPCLSIHIRWSDKGNGRGKIPIERFLPYVETFVKEGGNQFS